MKTTIISLVLIFFAVYSFAQEPDWAWVERAGGSSYDYGYAMCSDTDGNVYVTGFFQYTSDFGSHILTSHGGCDIFVAKIDANGNWIWITQAGGNGWDISTGISIDCDGNIYVSGYFNGTINFGFNSLTSSGNKDIFVAKMSNEGNWLWAKKAGGSEHDRGNGIIADANGNIYVTGFFTEIGNFGAFSLISSGIWDIFVAKMDAYGNWLWVERAGGSSNDSGNGINTDADGNIYVTGTIRNLANFGSISLNSLGDTDIFVTKLNAEGEWLWAVQAGGSEHDFGNSLCSDENGNISVTGNFQLTANFGSFTQTSFGDNDIFLAKINTHGIWTSVEKAGGNGYDAGKGINTDADGNVFITGIFSGTASFGSLNITSYGLGDIFVAKMDAEGEWFWVKQAGCSAIFDSDRGLGISLDSIGNVYVTGNFYYTANFGSFYLTSNGDCDIFVTKLSDATSIGNEITTVKYSLSNHPNPFNPTTTIFFSLQNNSNVEISIYNIKGQKIKSLLSDQITAGDHSIVWNGKDDSGKKVSSGVYLYKLKMNDKIELVRKCLLLK